jgi:allantoate deiminase
MIIAHCRKLALMSEEAGRTTRTFLSPPMREVHKYIGSWMESLGMRVTVDAAGNLRGLFSCGRASAPRLVIGSHLDSVPDAGAFDGVLGVVIGVGLIEELRDTKLGIDIEVIGFSEEEGVRFGAPFIGSRAVVGQLDEALLAKPDAMGVSVAEAIQNFGLDPARLPDALLDSKAIGYLEFHIEQGPVLEWLDMPLGIVVCISGQSRGAATFRGNANHAGTTPMRLRHDALAAAAEWIVLVETLANRTEGLVATVGRIDARPGAGNVIAGSVEASLDVRHASDTTRLEALNFLLHAAEEIATRRGIAVEWREHLSQNTVAMDPALTARLERAAHPAVRLFSGAGHDAMVLAPHIPSAMLFLRSPGGISHHPDESVLAADVDAAMRAGLQFIAGLNAEYRGDSSCTT